MSAETFEGVQRLVFFECVVEDEADIIFQGKISWWFRQVCWTFSSSEIKLYNMQQPHHVAIWLSKEDDWD